MGKSVNLVIPNNTIEIIDTAGNDDFSAVIDGWIGEGDGFLLVFAIDDQYGYDMVEKRHGSAGSMEPMIYPGDVVLVKKITTLEGIDDLQIGDVIQFQRDRKSVV